MVANEKIDLEYLQGRFKEYDLRKGKPPLRVLGILNHL